MLRTCFMCVVLAGTSQAQESNGWRLAWADEFEGPAGSSIDASKWAFDLGTGAPRNPGWGNHELQAYSDSRENVFLDGHGHLVIRATQTSSGYASGRIKTQGKYEFLYGRVEARIKPSYQQGIWQAFWMLGASYRTIAWPICGEIDITETFGAQSGDPFSTRGTIHGPGYANAGLTQPHRVPGNRPISDDFHVFAIEWEKDSIKFFVDGDFYFEEAPAKLPAGGVWVFNQPFFMVLNVAVGGFPAPVGYPDSSKPLPSHAEMLVDYVRVYQRRGESP